MATTSGVLFILSECKSIVPRSRQLCLPVYHTWGSARERPLILWNQTNVRQPHIAWKKQQLLLESVSISFHNFCLQRIALPCYMRQRDAFAKPTQNRHIHATVYFYQLWPHVRLIDTKAGLNIVSTTVLRRKWSAKIRRQRVTKLQSRIEKTIRLFETVILIGQFGALNVRVWLE